MHIPADSGVASVRRFNELAQSVSLQAHSISAGHVASMRISQPLGTAQSPTSFSAPRTVFGAPANANENDAAAVVVAPSGDFASPQPGPLRDMAASGMSASTTNAAPRREADRRQKFSSSHPSVDAGLARPKRLRAGMSFLGQSVQAAASAAAINGPDYMPVGPQGRGRRNPFVYDSVASSGVLPALKMGLVVVLLLPLRIFLVFVSGAMLICTALAVSLVRRCGRAVDDQGRPMPQKSGFADAVVRLASRVMLLGFGYWWIGEDFAPGVTRRALRSAAVVVSTHTSFVEVLYLAHLLGAGMVVGREDILRRLPFVATIAALGHAMVIDPHDGDSRRWVASEVQRRVRWTLEQPAEVIERHGIWPPFVVFPEGTCTNGTAIIDFKTGAFIPGVPVHPVICRFPYKSLDPTWPANTSVGTVAMALMCQLYNTMEVMLPQPIDPRVEVGSPKGGAGFGGNEFSGVGTADHSPEPSSKGADPLCFARHAQATMAAAARLPATRHSYDDAILFAFATEKLKLPPCALDAVVAADVSDAVASVQQGRSPTASFNASDFGSSAHLTDHGSGGFPVSVSKRPTPTLGGSGVPPNSVFSGATPGNPNGSNVSHTDDCGDVTLARTRLIRRLAPAGGPSPTTQFFGSPTAGLRPYRPAGQVEEHLRPRVIIMNALTAYDSDPTPLRPNWDSTTVHGRAAIAEGVALAVIDEVRRAVAEGPMPGGSASVSLSQDATFGAEEGTSSDVQRLPAPPAFIGTSQLRSQSAQSESSGVVELSDRPPAAAVGWASVSQSNGNSHASVRSFGRVF